MKRHMVWSQPKPCAKIIVAAPSPAMCTLFLEMMDMILSVGELKAAHQLWIIAFLQFTMPAVSIVRHMRPE
jgi:hypothetical protein